MKISEAENLIIVDSRLERLIPQFLSNQKSDFLKMKESFKKPDFNELKQLGHKMKGGCGGYGFHELGRLGGLMETAAEAEKVQDIANLLDLMETHLNSLKVHFQKI